MCAGIKEKAKEPKKVRQDKGKKEEGNLGCLQTNNNLLWRQGTCLEKTPWAFGLVE